MQTQASTGGTHCGHHSPDLTDILFSHLHMNDDGVDLALHQLPHAPCTQLQQTVLLLGQTDSLLLGHPLPPLIHPVITSQEKVLLHQQRTKADRRPRVMRNLDLNYHSPISHHPTAPASKQDSGRSEIRMFR